MDFHNQLRHKLIINDHCLPTVMFKCQQALETRNISVGLSERSFIAHFEYDLCTYAMHFEISHRSWPERMLHQITKRLFFSFFEHLSAPPTWNVTYSKQLKHYLRLRFEPRQMPLVIIIGEKPRKRRTYATEQQHFFKDFCWKNLESFDLRRGTFCFGIIFIQMARIANRSPLQPVIFETNMEISRYRLH